MVFIGFFGNKEQLWEAAVPEDPRGYVPCFYFASVPTMSKDFSAIHIHTAGKMSSTNELLGVGTTHVTS